MNKNRILIFNRSALYNNCLNYVTMPLSPSHPFLSLRVPHVLKAWHTMALNVSIHWVLGDIAHVLYCCMQRQCLPCSQTQLQVLEQYDVMGLHS